METITPTPEFVAWTLAHSCALREETDITDPVAAERQLRVLRSLADALAAGRCHQGICVDEQETRGFRADDVLEVYGGAEFINTQCLPCPANTVATRGEGAWAGCFGWLILTPALRSALGASHQRLWMHRQADRDMLATQVDLFTTLAAADPLVHHYLAALRLASTRDVPLHWRLFPAGHTQGSTWWLPTHCPTCGAPQAREQRHCRVCGYIGHCAPEQKRKARGQRPFTPLAKFLGEAGAEAFLLSYRARPGEVE